MNIITIIIVAIVVLVIALIWMYNRLVTMRNRVDEGWADIDVQLKRRYDLIPNLIETVKGYAAHELQTFQAVVDARSAATAINVDASNISGETITALAGASAGLGGALNKLLAVAEAYPDLKADSNFLELQNSLQDTENKIQAARRFYNSVVRDYNIAIEQFPTNMIAGMFKFMIREFFELPEEHDAREPVAVSF